MREPFRTSIEEILDQLDGMPPEPEVSAAPVDRETLATPTEGLEPRAGPGKRVIVVGAGMAGLVAAFELARQGHDPLVLEARQRVGGRIYTLRNFAPGLYAEAGAMRIPRVHDLTLAYCRLFGLRLRPFIMGNPNGLVYVGGERMTAAEAASDPDRLGFELAEHERGRTYSDLWLDATRDLREMVDRDPDAAWVEIVRQYDQYSLREFLVEKRFSEGAIEMYGVMNFVESDMNNALIEELREDLGKAFEDMQEIVGGMDLLPRAFFAQIPDRIRFGAEVHAIDQDADGVTVHFKTEAGHYSERGRLRDLRNPLLGPATSRDPRALLAREAEGDPSAQLLGLDEDPLPGPREDLGAGRWDLRWGDGDGPPHPTDELPDARPDDEARRPPGKLYVVTGCLPLGCDGRGDAPRGGAR